MRPLLAVAALAILAASGCGVSDLIAAKQSPKEQVITGTLTIRGGESDNGSHGERCEMRGGYRDIQAGAQVVVTDSASKTIALGQLDAGKVHRPGDTAYPSRRCVFSFSVSAPAGLDFYGVEVSHRGRLQYTAGQVKSPLELTLDGG